MSYPISSSSFSELNAAAALTMCERKSASENLKAGKEEEKEKKAR